MKRQTVTVASASLLGALMACAPVQTQPTAKPVPQPQRQPTEPARLASVGPVLIEAPAQPVAASPVEQAYAKARAAHATGRLVEAAASYEEVLRLAPRHVGALNAVGVIHAQAGRTELALQMFDHALQIAPESAHLHNNAGYALLRAGRLDEARGRLTRALALNPENLQAKQNLELLAQAAQQTSKAAAPAAPVVPVVAAANGINLVAVAPNVYELRLPATTAPAGGRGEGLTIPQNLFAQALGSDGAAALRGVRLEVSNGVGTARLARRTADRLALAGMVPARLTNAKPYRQIRTEIQYASGQSAPAQALQARLPVSATVVAAGPLPRGVQLRLVLGHDLESRRFAAWLQGQAPTMLAQLGQGGGWVLG